MSDRASSVSLRAGPPSPSSPAAGSLKETQPSIPVSDQIPQTPTSPPLMSVSAQNYASNFTSSQASPNQQTTSQPANVSSPPSSAPMSTQPSQQPVVGPPQSFPTPASSVSGQFPGPPSADDAEQADKFVASAVPDASTPHADNRRTDHERQAGGTGVPHPGDAMDIDTDTALGRISSLDSLQKEFSSAYHLCKSCKSSPTPATGAG